MPKISVIVPVYNVEQYLPKCLDSIINQTFRDIEIICINDGSTDDSGKVLEEYAQKDSRIKILTQHNSGTAVARNLGLDNSASDYIAFIDSDDVVEANFISILLDNIEKTQADISCCDFRKMHMDKHSFMQKNKVKTSYDPLSALLGGRLPIYFNIWNKLYKKDVIGNLRFENKNQYEDWIFSSILFTKIKKMCWTNQALYQYRIRNDSTMRSPFNIDKLQSYVDGINIVYAFYKNNCPEFLTKIKKTRIAQTLKMLMKRALKSNDTEIILQTQKEIKNLYKHKLVSYSGLSIKNKFKLWKFLQ